MAKCNSKNKGHKFATGAALGADPVSLLAQAGIATHTATGNLLQKWARNDYEDLNPELVNALFTGENADQVIDAVGTGKDFSSVRNNDVLLNTWNDNYKIPTVEDPSGWEKFLDYEGKNFSTLFSGDLIGYGKNQVAGFKNLFGLNDTTNKYNEAVNLANYNTVHNFYNQAVLNDKEAQRQAMMNYFDNGGSLEDLNGVTTFNVGGTHEQNPYGGIQQGIASDGLPNEVEEGEVKWNDYIFSARSIPSESLLRKHNLID